MHDRKQCAAAKVRGGGPIHHGAPCVIADANTSALEARAERLERRHEVAYVPGDANAKVGEILRNVPAEERKRTLSFCFIDPYRLNIHFETVQRIADGRSVDFLILLALYVDANRNVGSYVKDASPTIDRFLGIRRGVSGGKRWPSVANRS